MIKSVAIQGIKGSFHHIVSQEYFDDTTDVLECLTFDRVVSSLINEETDAVIMALENSIAGSIIPNYALIDDSNLHIVGEHYLDIQHNLMALPGQSLEDIKEVYSHPMALLQCKAFFKKYPQIKLVEDKDTAEAVIENRQVTDGPQDRIYYLQEMIDRPPRDIRVITVGDQAISAMYRKSSGGFKTNIALGADPELCEITKEIEDLCEKTSKAVGGGILGIDLMEDKKRGLVVHEVNNTVEFKGLVKVSKKNIPKEMIDYAIRNIK